MFVFDGPLPKGLGAQVVGGTTTVVSPPPPESSESTASRADPPQAKSAPTISVRRSTRFDVAFEFDSRDSKPSGSGDLLGDGSGGEVPNHSRDGGDDDDADGDGGDGGGDDADGDEHAAPPEAQLQCDVQMVEMVGHRSASRSSPAAGCAASVAEEASLDLASAPASLDHGDSGSAWNRSGARAAGWSSVPLGRTGWCSSGGGRAVDTSSVGAKSASRAAASAARSAEPAAPASREQGRTTAVTCYVVEKAFLMYVPRHRR